jgi:hypothetical protein
MATRRASKSKTAPLIVELSAYILNRAARLSCGRSLSNYFRR